MNDPVEKAKKAIEEVFSDTSVPIEETKDRLHQLRDEIDELIGALH